MTAHVDEIQRLVAEEPTFDGEPDIAAIRRSGRRLRTRRRIATGVAGIAIVAGAAVPVAALTTGEPAPVPSAPATSGPPAPTETPTETLTDSSWALAPVTDLPTDLPDGCGSFACLDDGSPETGEVVGEPWAIGGFSTDPSGLPVFDEVIYAVRPSAGERPVVALGFRDGAELQRVAILFRPGQDFRDTPLQIAGAVPRQGWEGTTYAMLGMVREDPVTHVAWQTEPGPWDGARLNDEIVPGYAVFWALGQWDAAWATGGPAQVTVRVDGQEYAPPAL
jgi:hypothetical protein